jgi:hypothetical protein
MSEHDPFDGIYDDETSGDRVRPQEEAPPSEAQAAPNHPTPAQPAAGGQEPGRYSMTFLRRADKADLQQIARDRGLDASGTRDALISRIATHQATS